MKTRYASWLLTSAVCLASCSNETETSQDPTSDDPVAVEVTVLDYHPAPGQFVNKLPEWHDGDDADAMNARAAEAINSGSLVTLGAFGGYIVMRTHRPIVNRPGADMIVKGNAIVTGAEPGIVTVSTDGVTWYDLRGESWSDCIPAFTVTYSQPAADATDDRYILWQSPAGDSGYLTRNSAYHSQPYFPQWIAAGDPMTFTARRLPDNTIINASGYFELRPLTGYADSYPNTNALAWLDLDDAVDSAGNAVALTSISYIRVTTGVLGCHGALGEVSTEVSTIMAY